MHLDCHHLRLRRHQVESNEDFVFNQIVWFTRVNNTEVPAIDPEFTFYAHVVGSQLASPPTTTICPENVPKLPSCLPVILAPTQEICGTHCRCARQLGPRNPGVSTESRYQEIPISLSEGSADSNRDWLSREIRRSDAP